MMDAKVKNIYKKNLGTFFSPTSLNCDPLLLRPYPLCYKHVK